MIKKKFLKRVLTPFMIGILITTNITPVFAKETGTSGSDKKNVSETWSDGNMNITYDENGVTGSSESKKSYFESKTEENIDKNTEYITHIRKVPEGSTIVANVDTNIDTKTKGYTYWSKQIKLSEVPGGVYPLTPEGEVHVTTTQSEPITKIDTKDIYGTVQPDPIWQVVRHEGGYLVLDDIDGDYWVDGEDIYDWVYPEPKEVIIGQDTVVYKLERDGNRYVWVNQNDPNDKEQASSVQIADYKPIKINGQDYYVVNDIEKLKQEFPDAVGYIESRHTLQDATLNHIFTDKPRDEYMWFVYDQFGDQKYVYHTYINEIGLPDDQYGKYTVECKQAVDFTITDDYYWKEEYVIKVIHIVDTDGVFTKDCVMEADIEGIQYFEDHMECANVEAIERRNKHKSEILFKLYSTGKVHNNIVYRLYYNSCNLEHVLYGELKAFSDDEKEEMSDEFAEKYEGKVEDFIAFISDETIAVHGTYKETWRFIEKGKHSLERHSNMHLIFTK